MGEMYDLQAEFPQRTLALLNEYDGLYPETLLLNCLTGLLLLPREAQRQQEILPDIRVNDREHHWGLLSGHFRVHDNRRGLTLKNIVRQMRNSVAHAKLEAINGNGRIVAFVFKDDGFTARLPVEVLKRFACALAERYLITINQNIA